VRERSRAKPEQSCGSYLGLAVTKCSATALTLMLAALAPKFLLCRPFSPRFWARFSRYEVPEQLHRVGAQCPGDGDKLNQVNTAFATLIFGNEGLWLPQLGRQLLLLDARVMSHCDKHLNEPGIFGGFEGLLHAPPGQRIGGRQSDPRKGLSQNWIILSARANVPRVLRKRTAGPRMKRLIFILLGLGAVLGLGQLAVTLENYARPSPNQAIEFAKALDLKWTKSESAKPPNYILIEKAEVSRARAGLETIEKNSPRYTEAQTLLSRLSKHGEDGERAMAAAIAKSVDDDVTGRKELARTLEARFLKSGMDVTITQSGSKGTVLTLRYVLLNRVFLYKILNETELLKTCEKARFKKVVFTDGYNQTASYNLPQSN